MVVERWSILADDNNEDNILFFDPKVNIEELIKKAEKQLKKGFDPDKKPHEYIQPKVDLYMRGLPSPPRRTLFSNWEIFQDIRKFNNEKLSLLEFDFQDIIKPEKLSEFRNYAYEYELFSWIVNNATRPMPKETLDRLETVYKRDINNRKEEIKILSQDLNNNKAQPKKVIGYIKHHSNHDNKKLIEMAEQELMNADYKLACVIADREADRTKGNPREAQNLTYIIHLAIKLWNCLNKNNTDYLEGLNSKDLKQFIYKLILDVEELRETSLSNIDKAIKYAKKETFVFYDFIGVNNEKDFRRISQKLIR